MPRNLYIDRVLWCGGFLKYRVLYRITCFLMDLSLTVTVVLLSSILGEAIDYADYGRSDFSCGSNGQVLYSNLTVCQLEELKLCPSTYYPQFDAYLRPLTCPLPHCNPDGELMYIYIQAFLVCTVLRFEYLIHSIICRILIASERLQLCSF